MSADEQSVSKTKLFIGNLPFSVTEEELREAFAGFGELTSVSLITDRQTGRPRGFAFIEYADVAAAQAAVNGGNEMELGGRKLIVREARDRAERPSFERRSGGFRPNNNYRDRSRNDYDRN